MKRDEIERYEQEVTTPTRDVTAWEVAEYFEAY
jgi:hypothetical protein